MIAEIIHPRFLGDHEAYEFEFPRALRFEHLSVGAAFALQKEKYTKFLADFLKLSDAVQTSGVEAQWDDDGGSVKGPRALFDPLVEEGILVFERLPTEETHESLLSPLIYSYLTEGPSTLGGVLSNLEELTGWAGYNPSWVGEILSSLLESGDVLLEGDEFVAVADEEDVSPERSERHLKMYVAAELLGEPACAIVRGLIDEMYGDDPED